MSLLTDRPHQGLALFEYTRARPLLGVHGVSGAESESSWLFTRYSLSFLLCRDSDKFLEAVEVDPQLDIIWPDIPVATCPEDYFSVHWHGYLL